MFCVASLVPSPPVLVPELGGAAGDGEVTRVRAAALQAAKALSGRATRWIVIGTDEANRVIGADAVGTFRGYGADIRIGLSGTFQFGGDSNNSVTAVAEAADPELPLPVLIAGWLREQVAPDAVAEARLIDAATSPADCLTFGARLRGELDAETEPCAVLVVGDGAATLSLKAPRYFDERAESVQAEIDRALTAGDRRALAALDPRLCAELAVAGRPAYQILAGLFDADAADPQVETLYAAAPFGVGYHVSVWRPGGAA
ncbi:class III extradiol ring-cleavage dioxygenase family protein [Nocardia sp. IFM 10818]